MQTEQTTKVEMTSEELAQYNAFKKAQAREEQRKKEAEDREAYRALSAETVDAVIPMLKELNETLKASKEFVYQAFRGLIETKQDLFGSSVGKQLSHAYMNARGTARITIGYYQRDAWDDTVEAGIAKVKEYVSSLARDTETEQLVQMLLDLLAKDKQGNLQADKVLQLAKYADASDSDLFKDGVKIIKESYRPERTKLYIRAEERDKNAKWKNIPLGMTEV